MHVDRRAVGAVVVPIGLAHDPLNQAVARILETGLLGAPLHAFFENHASDTPLGPGHCFWNPEISGGIFIEHGVNFFDLFRMWFRPMNYSGVALERNPNGSGLCFIDP
jgi:predicted dehydrogenase